MNITFVILIKFTSKILYFKTRMNVTENLKK